MTEQDIIKLVNDQIRRKLEEVTDKITGFRRFHPLDSVTDVYSPITGASQQIGFFGTSKISKPTVSGSRGANAALASLCTALANLGLITNSTS